MTNTLAIILAASLVVLLGFDAIVFDWSNSTFMARKFLELIEWVAFWR